MVVTLVVTVLAVVTFLGLWYGAIVLTRMVIARSYGQHASGQSMSEMTQDRIRRPSTLSTYRQIQNRYDRLTDELVAATAAKVRWAIPLSERSGSHLASYRLDAPTYAPMVNGAAPIQIPVLPEWDAILRKFDADMRDIMRSVEHAGNAA